MNESRLASAECYIAWDSADAPHKDWKYFHKIDFRRDLLPGNLKDQFVHMNKGDIAETDILACEIFPAPQADAVKCIRQNDITTVVVSHHISGPYLGRHYPKGLLAGCSGTGTIFPAETAR